MPYIAPSKRNEIKPKLTEFWQNCPIREPGELNYVITQLVELYRGGKYRYNLFNEIIGILECVKQEYYRRMIAEYEDRKCEEQGDVYHW